MDYAKSTTPIMEVNEMDKTIIQACGKIMGALLLGEAVRFIGREIYKKGERDGMRKMRRAGYYFVDEDGNVVEYL